MVLPLSLLSFFEGRSFPFEALNAFANLLSTSSMASSDDLNNLAGAQPFVQVDDLPDTDQDSAYDGDSLDQSWTTSLKSSVLNYRKLYGRTYHAHEEDRYVFPNDEPELERLDLQHHMCVISNRGKAFLAPIPENPEHVLDVGTGTGIWAIEFAEQYPNASVVGTDLSATQPTWVPPNVRFEIDDANHTWTFAEKFDYIHCRYFHMAIEEKKLFKQAYEALKPGGWFEIRETALPLQCDDGTLEGTPLSYWCEQQLKLGRMRGMNFDNPFKYRQWVEEAGFVNVVEHAQILPVSPWPKDAHLKQIGRWIQFSFGEGLEAFSLQMWLEQTGWSYEEYQVFLAKVRKDIQSRKVHGYLRSFTICGQKPKM
jgi:ubiquinone/menaquinone biosynthesis C-methylase UbiE